MEQLFYYHQNRDNANQNNLTEGIEFETSTEKIQNVVVWETCLRKIIFCKQDETTENFLKINDQLQLLVGAEALQFLIEVLCGLKSKIIGETEIFGQFRKFIETAEAKKIPLFQNQQFVQFLFQQVKEIREKHLLGLAVHSYGSLIRKKFQNEDVVSLIGYGHLAQEIIPWLKNKKVNVFVRQTSRFQNTEQLQFFELGQNTLQGAVVLAAPVQVEKLIQLFNESQDLHQIIDCRGLDQNNRSLKNSIHLATENIIELKDLFQLLENEQKKIIDIVPFVQSEIAKRVENYLFKAQHRPMGWEDLC